MTVSSSFKLGKGFVFVLLLTMVLLFSFNTPAVADDTIDTVDTVVNDIVNTTEEGEEEEVSDPLAEDNFMGKLYLSYYSLYDVSKIISEKETVQEMIAELQKIDIWARYYSKQDFEAYAQDHAGSIIGIGIYYVVEDDKMLITGVFTDSPAKRSGIESGDIVTHINGQAIAGMTQDEIQIFMRSLEEVAVTMQIVRNGVEKQFVMEMEELLIASVYWEMLDGDIGHVIIESFTQNTATEFLYAYSDIALKGGKGIILDLRYCPGGVIDSAVELVSSFVEKGPIIFIEESAQIYFYPAIPSVQVNIPMVVLVNEYTASAAELVSADFQDLNRALVIGTPTYGKGLVQSVISLPSGAGIVFTSGRYFSRGYQDIAATGGVFPDIYIEDEEQQLIKAMEVLRLQFSAAKNMLFTMDQKAAVVDGVEKELFAAPFMQDNFSYLPLRQTLESFGWEVFWYDGMIYLQSSHARFTIDTFNGTIYSNKLSQPLDLIIKDGVTYVPTSVLRSLFNYKVTWNGEAGSVMVQK